jgi:hypothetical protein
LKGKSKVEGHRSPLKRSVGLLVIVRVHIMKTLAAKLIAVATAVFAFGLLNKFFPVLRFSDELANEAAGIFILTLPLMVILLSFFIPNRTAKIVMILALLPVVGLCLVGQTLLWFALTAGAKGGDRSFEPISMVALNGTQVIAYRTDGGATTDLGIVIRQQRRLMPGLLVVRELYSEYHAQDARLEMAGPEAVRIILNRADGELTFPVRRFVWF